ncbi:VOC family protein [Mucisphaera calidilacus]|uniref:Putative lyase n=1 Tax=Mucisphaera calidilacus TaxID=2527982 RepID=A0A518BZE3_9BACT|nr:VOC family protein [Mucisphaera calidilacus]QDU72347.1 putative lyase [Mucisphaera calidilacus]
MSHENTRVSGCGFHHVAISVRDFDASLAFYTDLLGFKPRVRWQAPPKRAVMLDTGDGNYIEVFEAPDKPEHKDAGNEPWFHIALRCTNLDEVVARVREAGFTVTMEPLSLDIEASDSDEKIPIRIAFFNGPNGESIELFQNEVL